MTIFGFNGDTTGFKSILEKIANNDGSGRLTHKNVRAYARCMLNTLPGFKIHERVKPEIETLLASLSMNGIPHYDRSFIATMILKLLEDSASFERQEIDRESF